MTGNASKWMEIVVKGCIISINASNWLIMTETSKNGRKCIRNWRKWIILTSNGWARKCYVKYQCHVQSYTAAAMAWEMPRRISDFGIPFLNRRALMSRHQLGATRLTVDTKIVVKLVVGGSVINRATPFIFYKKRLFVWPLHRCGKILLSNFYSPACFSLSSPVFFQLRNIARDNRYCEQSWA